jgi:1-acyl-sn-glycerol-3-phosphate acyltransferase
MDASTTGCTMRQKLFFLITIFSFGILYIHTTIAVLFSLAFGLINQKKMIRLVALVWSKMCFWLLLKRIHIYGLANIEKDKKYILLINHSSLFDIMAVMSVLPDISWFGREYLINIFLFGKILRMIDYIPMKSGDFHQTKYMLNQMIEKAGNKTVAIFPEGTRTQSGQLGRLHKGFLYVQKATNRDILPLTLSGFFRFKPKTRFSIDYQAPLLIYIHEPIKNGTLKELSDQQILELVKSTIESKL